MLIKAYKEIITIFAEKRQTGNFMHIRDTFYCCDGRNENACIC